MAEPEKERDKYSLIVPTYNERINIALLVYLIFKHLPYVSISLFAIVSLYRSFVIFFATRLSGML